MRELTSHLRQNRATLCHEWVRRIAATRLLGSMSVSDITSVADGVFDGYVAVLESGDIDQLRRFLQGIPARSGLRGIPHQNVLAVVYQLRDVVGRSLFQKFRHFDTRSTGLNAARAV